MCLLSRLLLFNNDPVFLHPPRNGAFLHYCSLPIGDLSDGFYSSSTIFPLLSLSRLLCAASLVSVSIGSSSSLCACLLGYSLSLPVWCWSDTLTNMVDVERHQRLCLSFDFLVWSFFSAFLPLISASSHFIPQLVHLSSIMASCCLLMLLQQYKPAPVVNSRSKELKCC